jgi:hypothetical protein
MAKSVFLKLFAALGLALSNPTFAQVTTIDPDKAGEYEPVPAPVQSSTEEYQPVDAGSQDIGATMPAQERQAPQASAEERASAAVSNTVAKDDVLSAAEGLFGRGAEGLAGLIEDIFRKQGEPNAYITGSEAGGAIAVGLRYGSGLLHQDTQSDRKVYWTGPSIGFDLGADANKVFVLVYNLQDSEALFKRFPAAEGNVYVVGGFTASYLRRGDIVLIPIRLGVGLRMGVNAGYMRFSKKSRWLPF